jgi:hypothetical protein
MFPLLQALQVHSFVTIVLLGKAEGLFGVVFKTENVYTSVKGQIAIT